jgi:hypothetical protein
MTVPAYVRCDPDSKCLPFTTQDRFDGVRLAIVGHFLPTARPAVTTFWPRVGRTGC